jgi:hypothetical protein
VTALSGVESLEFNILDTLQQREFTGGNTEYLDGELGNNTQYRRKWDIELQPAVYAGDFAIFNGINTTDTLRNLDLLLSKKYLWVDFSGYETEHETHAHDRHAHDTSHGHDRLLPVVHLGTKISANRAKGTRLCSFTVRHRWANDYTLTTVV